MTDQDILARIRELVESEHRLRAKTAAGQLDPEAEQRELAQLETLLDQCWDLLRQRRAARDDGAVDEPQVRSANQVEGYLQ